MNCKLEILAKRVFCLNWRDLAVLDSVVPHFLFGILFPAEKCMEN